MKLSNQMALLIVVSIAYNRNIENISLRKKLGDVKSNGIHKVEYMIKDLTRNTEETCEFRKHTGEQKM